MAQKVFCERMGKVRDVDRSFDLEFWQAQSAEERFAAVWELVVHCARVKGLDERDLRLQRSVEHYGKQPGNEADFGEVSR